MKKIVFIIWITLLSFQTFGQKIKLVRVCNGGNNNSINWQIYPDTCILLNTLKIYGRDAIGQSFFGIDSGITTSGKNYLHLNANVPSTKDWRYYLAFQRLCGTDTFNSSTDTLAIDDIKPDSSILDSVSIDPITNKIYLGWTSNKTPDFSSYYLYNYDRPDPRLAENYKDTFFIDNSPNDPRNKALSYDITSADSCDNRKDYGNYLHKTIWMSGTIDTCKNEVSLKWTKYIGWNTRKYFLFKKTNAGAFLLIDSLNPTIQNYTDNDISKNNIYQYFIRAEKIDLFRKISASSNSTYTLNSGKTNSPHNTLIKQVGLNTNNNVEIQISRNPISDYGAIDLFRVHQNESPVFLHSFGPSEIVYEDASADIKANHNYYIIGKNVCGISSDSSTNSNNIVLTLNKKNLYIDLSWGKYFTWNAGVKFYTIYRASGNTITNASNFMALPNNTMDSFYSLPETDQSVDCYYIEALENGGSGVSKSNIACYIKTGNIYYPNAISVFGINKTFTFSGAGIDLSKTSIQIFNRWGQLEYNTDNFISGWFAKNNAGEYVPTGVYFFIAKVYQGEKTIEIHGNITVLE